MAKKVLIALGVLLGVLLVVIVLQPATYHVERSVVVKAPPAVVFPFANNFKQWHVWSPWSKLDPDMKTTYSDPPAGKGATYEWVGNDDVGQGKMTIIESVPDEKVAIDLHFITPFESQAQTDVLLAKEGEGTKVTWTMHGDNTFMGKAMGLFMSMDDMIGADYEKGLAALKPLVEQAAADQAAPPADAADGAPAAEAPADDADPDAAE